MVYCTISTVQHESQSSNMSVHVCERDISTIFKLQHVYVFNLPSTDHPYKECDDNKEDDSGCNTSCDVCKL